MPPLSRGSSKIFFTCATLSPTRRSITGGSGRHPQDSPPQAPGPGHTPRNLLRPHRRLLFRAAVVPGIVGEVVAVNCPRPITPPTMSRTRTSTGGAIGTGTTSTAATGIATVRPTATATRRRLRATSCSVSHLHRHHITTTPPRANATQRPMPRPPRPAKPCPLRSTAGTTWTSPRRWST